MSPLPWSSCTPPGIRPSLFLLLHLISYLIHCLFVCLNVFLNPPFHHSYISFLCLNYSQVNNSPQVPFSSFVPNLFSHHPTQIQCFWHHYLGRFSLTCYYWNHHLDGSSLAPQASLLTLQLYFLSKQCCLDTVFLPDPWHPYLILIKHKQFGHQNNDIIQLTFSPCFFPPAVSITPLVPVWTLHGCCAWRHRQLLLLSRQSLFDLGKFD